MAAANYSSCEYVYGKVVLDKFVKTSRNPGICQQVGWCLVDLRNLQECMICMMYRYVVCVAVAQG